MISQIPNEAACVSFGGSGIGAWWNWLPWTFDHRTAGEGWPQCHSDQPRLSLLGCFPAVSTTHHSLEANWPAAQGHIWTNDRVDVYDDMHLFLIECDCLVHVAERVPVPDPQV